MSVAMTDPSTPFKREITANASLLQVFPAGSPFFGARTHDRPASGACRAV
jgi:hypothetical protein